MTVSVTVGRGTSGESPGSGVAGTESGADGVDDGSEGSGDEETDGSGSGDEEADSEAGEDDGEGSEPAVSVEADQAADGTNSTQNAQEIRHARILPSSRSTAVLRLNDLDSRQNLSESETRQGNAVATGRSRAGNALTVSRCGCDY